ncbi:MAG: hypothetical protein AB4042_11430 [Leptolyngbyaceae cyanobacterium]
MDNEFAKKVGRDAFEKLSKQTQALILECSDHQKWLDTEQTKLDYIYSLAQRYPIYQKYGSEMAEETERKIQRAFQTLVIEGRSEIANQSIPIGDNHSNGGRPNHSGSRNSAPATNGHQSRPSNGQSTSHQVASRQVTSRQPDHEEHSLEEDLELSFSGL